MISWYPLLIVSLVISASAQVNEEIENKDEFKVTVGDLVDMFNDNKSEDEEKNIKKLFSSNVTKTILPKQTRTELKVDFNSVVGL